MKYVSDLIKFKDIDRWVEGYIIAINAHTGSGKSYFIKKILKDYRSEERRVGKECRSRWSPYH